MPPDLNSLPPSRPPSLPASPTQQQPRRPSLSNADPHWPTPPSPRSPSLSSLQAAAAINAGLHRRSPSNASPRRNSQALERRRSSLMNNLSINDPTVPGPGELQTSSGGSSSNSPGLGRRAMGGTADPNHQRQPSLGEIHQSLENEQEAQVNRLLHMIRVQQDQIAQMQRQQHSSQDPSSTPTDHANLPTPPSSTNTPIGITTTDHTSPRRTSISALPFSGHSHSHSHSHFNRPHSLSRTSSARTNSQANSPAIPPTGGGGGIGPLTEDFLLGGTRDECAFYQAETLTLTRENQMLKQRIRELERQIAGLGVGAGGLQGDGGAAAVRAGEGVQSSPLATQGVASAGEGAAEVDSEAKPD